MKLRNFLIQPIALRVMAVTVCVLTNIYFILLFWLPVDYRLTFFIAQAKFTAGAWMLILFFLLRHSLREITGPKAADLDEMQLALRNEAYQLGYLVVRRVGLGISIAGAMALPFVQQLLMSSSMSVTQNGVKTTNRDWLSATKATRDYLNYYFQAHNLLPIALDVAMVMTFAAYCFPLVILAWRYARIQGALKASPEAPISVEGAHATSSSNGERSSISSADLLSAAQRLVSVFRRQLTVIAIGWPLLIGAGIGVMVASSSSYGITSTLYPVLLMIASLFMCFTVWVMLAGMFKQLRLVSYLRIAVKRGIAQQTPVTLVRGLSIVTGIASISLPVIALVIVPAAPFGIHEWWFAVWPLSIATLIAQTTSFVIAGNAAKNARALLASS